MQNGPAIACSSDMTSVPASGSVVLLGLHGLDGLDVVEAKVLDWPGLADTSSCADRRWLKACLVVTNAGDCVATVVLRNNFARVHRCRSSAMIYRWIG